MRRSIGVGLASGAVFVVWILNPAQSRNAPQPESIHLIESVQGQALFVAYCAVCHGKDGKGDGPLAKAFRSATPDLTRVAARSGGQFPSARVQRVISGEEPFPGGHGTRDMPVWGPIFSQVAWDQDLGRIRIYNLAKYIEEMQVR